MLKVSYDTFSKEWLLWRPSHGIISTHKTRKQAETALWLEQTLAALGHRDTEG